MDEFLARFPATVELSVCAMLFALIVGLPAGVFAALKRGTAVDHGVMGTALTGYSMPIFWWGLILIMLFSVKLGWTPVSGRIAVEFDIPHVTGFMLIDSLLPGTDEGSFRSALSHLILPAIVLGTIPLAVVARMTRSSMLEVLREDYIRTARAKGLSERQVLFRHILRNSLIPIISLWGLDLAQVIGGGAILTETVYNLHGIGQLAATAISNLDIITLMAITLLTAFFVVLLSAVTDIVYALLDPRIRLS
jgi:dipeptide transport system permease protein